MKNELSVTLPDKDSPRSRRSFLRKGLAVGGAITTSAGLLSAQDDGRRLNQGDEAILRLLAAAEIIESDLWEQYAELSSAVGVNSDFASPNPATGTKPTPTGGNAAYTAALQVLDGDMPQYIHDNTDDEFSHANFLIAYLKSKGANTAELDLLAGTHFRTLQGSLATGSAKKGRLTNLTQLTVDTSYWGRYRTDRCQGHLRGTLRRPLSIRPPTRRVRRRDHAGQDDT